MPQEPSVARLRRILVLVPWVMANPGASVTEVCRRFGMTREELAADLELLFVCGLPPFGPGDLIEAYIEGDRVVIQMAAYLARPLRLSRAEATALLVMGRAMAELPGLEEAASLRSALSKLERTLSPGEAPSTLDLARRVTVEWDETPGELLAALRDAISERRSLRITYYSAGRDALGERSVDPLLVFGAMGRWYLAAMDRASGEERVFRVDRIRDAAPTGETFAPPEGFDAGKYAEGPLVTPSARDLEAVLDVAPEAAWVREVTPHDAEEALADGWTRLRLRTAHLAWLVRLLLRLGPRARTVAPPELAEAVRQTARRALARYGADGGAGDRA